MTASPPTSRTVCVVTGGGSGIGAACCRAFGRLGHQVVVADLDVAAAGAVAATIDLAEAAGLDVTDSTAVDELMGRVVAQYGRVDVVVTAAGVDDPAAKARIGERTAAGQPLEVTVGLDDARWRRLLAVNLDGTFFTVRAALRVMAAQGSGAVVTIASTAAYDAPAGYAHYSAAKAGVVALTQSVGKEAVAHGVRVNGVAPGPTVTPMRERTPPANHRAAGGQPVRPPAAASKIADVVVFLAGEGAANLAGEVVIANGGRFTA